MPDVLANDLPWPRAPELPVSACSHFRPRVPETDVYLHPHVTRVSLAAFSMSLVAVPLGLSVPVIFKSSMVFLPPHS